MHFGRTRLILCVVLASLCVPACGSKNYYVRLDGNIFVDNLTDTTLPESLLTFRVAPLGEPFSGDLLGGELFPGEARFIGVFAEDFYDAEGDLEFGQIIEWFDVFVGNGENVYFEVF